MAIDPDKPDATLIASLAATYKTSARRLAQQITDPPGRTNRSRKWNSQRAAQVLSRVEDELSNLKSAANDWATAAVQDAVTRGVRAGDRQARQANIRPINQPTQGGFDVIDRRTIEIITRDTLGDLHKAADSMQAQAASTLRRMAAMGVSHEQVNDILTRGVIEGHPQQAIRELRKSLQAVHGGLVTVIDKNGEPRMFEAGYYAQMVAVTKTRQATVAARQSRLQEYGVDLVVVIGSYSDNFCTAYMDKVFSISGNHPVYPPLSSLPGGGPPFHPNCTKGTAPFIEELADPDEREAAEPDPATEMMLNESDRSELQRRFERNNVKRRVDRRAEKIRRDAGRKIATQQQDDPKYQAHLLRELGVKSVQLRGHPEIGAKAVQGFQQVVASGGTLPDAIVVDALLFKNEDGSVSSRKIALYDPSSNMIAFNPDWPGWQDASVMRQYYSDRTFSSPSPLHPVFHEAAHNHLIVTGTSHDKAPFVLRGDWEVAEKVSMRARVNKDEFLAEFRAARMAGQGFDDDVFELYQKLGGR